MALYGAELFGILVEFPEELCSNRLDNREVFAFDQASPTGVARCCGWCTTPPEFERLRDDGFFDPENGF